MAAADDRPGRPAKRLIWSFFDGALETAIAIIDGVSLRGAVPGRGGNRNACGRRQRPAGSDALVIPGHGLPITPVGVADAGGEGQGK